MLGMLFDPEFDSGGESDIEEDQAFPLPQPEDADPSPTQSPRSSSSLDRPAVESGLGRSSESPVDDMECEESTVRGRQRQRGATVRRNTKGSYT